MWICPVCQKENIDNAHVCLSCRQGKLCYTCGGTFSGDVCNSCGKDYTSSIWLTQEQYDEYIAPAVAVIEENAQEPIEEVSETETQTEETNSEETNSEEINSEEINAQQEIIEEEPDNDESEASEESAPEEKTEISLPKKKRKGMKIFFWIALVFIICALVCAQQYYMYITREGTSIDEQIESDASFSISSSALSDANVDSSASSDAFADSSAMSDAMTQQ